MARPGEHLHPVPAGQLQGLLTSAAAPGRWSEAARVEGVPSPPAPTAARCRIIRRGRNASGQPLYRHAIGDQRRREVCECGAQDPGRIGQLRVDGEPFGQQESRPAHSRVLSRCRGHDRGSAPVAITTRPCWPLSHRRCSAAVQTAGLPKAAGSSRPGHTSGSVSTYPGRCEVIQSLVAVVGMVARSGMSSTSLRSTCSALGMT